MRARMLLSPRVTLGLGVLGLFALLASLYTSSIGMRATTNAAITGDEPFYLLTTQSLIDDRNLDLREQYERESYLVFFDHPDGLWKQSLPRPDGRILSPHEPGLSILLIPGFAFGELKGAQFELLAITAATFSLAFLLVAIETGRPLVAWFVTAVVGLTAPAFVYSTEIYPEMPAALCLVVALLFRRARGPLRIVGLAICLSALAWLGLKYVPLGIVVAAAHLFSAPRRDRWQFVVLCSASAGLYAWWHLATFGALTPYNGNTVYEGAATSAVLDSHFAFEGRWYRLWGLFVDRNFGIGRWAPVLLAVVPALPLLVTKRGGWTIPALIVTQILVATFVAITMMGWWFPGRMLIVVFPLFALPLAHAWIRAPRTLRIAGAAGAAYSLLVTLLLIIAARQGDVRIAVDPFALQAPLFRYAEALFPDYRWWTNETIALNLGWVALLGSALVGVIVRSTDTGRRLSRLLRQGPGGMQWASRIAQEETP